MHRFLIVFEKADQNWAAYSPDLPGCVATGGTREETEDNMREAVRFHVEGLREEGMEVPEGHSFAEVFAVS
ncbi:MAG: type II toxin-antitoxin system HicB family antitoxin [Rubrobacter sp.]|jgi:predicted RNase H-like HicB family nuclease|nr:type II toxin-antitoxin system HicB family antitoxin [Rubrobacter sp.]